MRRRGGYLLGMGLSATRRRTVASHVLRSAVLAPVLIVVTEIEGRIGRDELSAAPALHVAGSDEWSPSRTLSLVIAAIASRSRRTSRSLTLTSMLRAATLCLQLRAARYGADLHGLAGHLSRWSDTIVLTGCR